MPKPYIMMPESHWVNALDAVREKTGTTGTISSEELAAEIGRIEGGGINTSDATATADKIFKDESAYVDGEKLIGTFTIDSELTEQNDLISQISTLVAQKATPPSTDTSDATATAYDIAENKSAYVKGQKVEGALYDYRGRSDYGISLIDSYRWNDNDWTVDFEIDDYGVFDNATVFKMDPGELASGIGLTADKIAEGETIMGIEGTHSGGSGGGASVEYEVINITDTNVTSIPFTLKRITKTFGLFNGESGSGAPSVGANFVSAHIDTYRFSYTGSPMGTYVNKSEALTLESGVLSLSGNYVFTAPYMAIFINDPAQPALYEE